MLTSKSFYRKTKGGNIYKVVREHYLRDDIWCGSEACRKCGRRKQEILLDEENPGAKSTLFAMPHYLVLDTNIVLNQIDILDENILCNVIVPQTTLNEVRHRSSNVYKKLKEIINDPHRKFYIFINEHHKDTYIERKHGEIINDRNDRALRIVTHWYNTHLSKQKIDIKVILVTDDHENKSKAEKLGIPVVTMVEYVNSLENAGFLIDKLSKKSYILDGDARAPLFPCHLSPSQIHDGIKSATLIQGTFLASRENFLEGSVNCESIEKFILIQGRESLNRAIDGDTVAVELFSEDQWSAPSEVILIDEAEDDPGDVIDDENILAENKKIPTVEKTPTGRIVGIIRRKWRQYCGILQRSALKDNTHHLFMPAERKIPKVRIESKQAETLCTQRIIVAIDSWPRHSRYPLGHFVRALGTIGDKDTENEVLLLEHDVPHSRFSDEVLSFLPKLPWTITDSDVNQRTDLRSLEICSVDPPGCTDIDDALHCRELPNGNLEVGVHIADVSHFIRPGTALDREAASRARTVYLVDTRIDMVPELLSSDLCSLKSKEERFAFSCIWEVDHNANIITTEFFKSIILSRASLTYEEAQLRIDDERQNDDLTKSLRSLNNLAKKLKKMRLDKGALVLASPEVRFHVDSETHDPIDIEAKKVLETNSMVEEFMLLANISVAKKILMEFPECSMLRRHPEPPQVNFDPLIKAGRHQGFEINTSSGMELAKSLEAAQKKDNPYFNTMLKIVATRCMMQAVYFTSGMLQEPEFFHYGLACPIYTHFTSPIRRYADIIVHRLLAVSIGADATYSELLDKKKSHALCHNLNYRNRMAQYSTLFQLFFRNKVQLEDGYILFVRKNALQILIPKFGLEGTLYLSKKGEVPEVNFIFDAEKHIQQYGDIIFRPFDQVTVQLSLDRSNIQHEKLIFKLVKPVIPGFSIPYDSESIVTSGYSDKNTKDSPIEVMDISEAPKRKNINTPVNQKPVQLSKGKRKRKKKY
ncbi:PREDICTED: exosome complex exonuclease RRP44 [Ceratosolen solmsi marchali]|uniref:Protein DIS3 homolog n=1 Tax=Ceratosolen solmsi marchali TaxID=326594 RepID=A0AAJ6YR46_9HYME|nr:PREDICTED: exosome complex exonuclease RRP44 [Ceratosolen solmsi marchali]